MILNSDGVLNARPITYIRLQSDICCLEIFSFTSHFVQVAFLVSMLSGEGAVWAVAHFRFLACQPQLGMSFKCGHIVLRFICSG